MGLEGLGGLAGLEGLIAPEAYYVDATGGNDGNDGLSEETAWQTRGKVNSSIFVPGDDILFKRGEIFRGDTLIIDQGGALDNHVTYGAYGVGDRPIFSAARLIAGWVSTVGEEYKADLAASQGDIDPRSVWQNDIQLVLGVEGGLARGEYFYDAPNDELHVRTFDGTDPTAHTIEAANNRGCVIVLASYVTTRDIVCEKGNTYNFDIRDATPNLTNITVRRVDSNRGAWHGIIMGNSGGASKTPNNVTLEECKVYMWNRAGTNSEDGISQFAGDGSGGNNLRIRYCTIEGDVPWGVNTNGGMNGISVLGGDGILIEWTEITGSDHGIALFYVTTTGWIIRYNFIHETGDDAFELTDINDENGLIHNNLLYRNSDNFFDINMTDVGDAGRIYNNSCYECLNEPINIHGNNGTRATIKNNIIGITQTPSTRFYSINDIAGTVDIQDFDIDHNIYYDYVDSPGTAVFAKFQSGNLSFAQWQALNLDLSGKVEDPEYSDAGGAPVSVDDYKVEPTSPAIDAGADLGLLEDYFGTSIPQGAFPDIGFFEYVS